LGLRAVVFDYGMVLTALPDSAAHDALLRITGLPLERFESLYWADRHAYDEGKLTGLAFWQKLIRQAGLDLPASTIDELNLWDARMWTTQNPAMLAWQLQLKQRGLLTGILSNMGDNVLANIDSNLEPAIDRLFHLLEIPSISAIPAHFPDCDRAAGWLVRELTQLGFEATRVDTPGRPMVMGSGPRTTRAPSAVTIEAAGRPEGPSWTSETISNRPLRWRGSSMTDTVTGPTVSAPWRFVTPLSPAAPLKVRLLAPSANVVTPVLSFTELATTLPVRVLVAVVVR